MVSSDLRKNLLKIINKEKRFFNLFSQKFYPFSLEQIKKYFFKWDHLNDGLIASNNQIIINDSFVDLVMSTADNRDELSASISYLSGNENLRLTPKLVIKYLGSETLIDEPYYDFEIYEFSARWDFEELSKRKDILGCSSIVSILNEKLNWTTISNSTKILWSEDLLARYANKLNWEDLSKNTSVPFSIKLINRFKLKWDWKNLSQNASIPWSYRLIHEFKDYWQWPADLEINDSDTPLEIMGKLEISIDT